MKARTLFLALALASAPALSLAQQSPPSGPPPMPSPQMRALMKQAREARERFRAQVLDAISSAHRAAIANVIGQLAVSANPNFRAAAAQIDQTLSSGEKQQIMSARSAFENQMQSLHRQMRSQMQGTEAPHGPATWRDSKRIPSAGMVVLNALSGEGPHMMMLMRHLAPPPSP